MAEQLTTLDAGFLEVEDAGRHTNLGIGGLAILDGPIPDHGSLMSTLGDRIAVCPRFAQRLRRRIFDLSAPEWADDGDFNLAHHVRRIAVPAPGTDDELFRVVADVMSWPLDRDRPLWEIWVIDGLSGNRWAMLMKVHPCIADAIATVHILTGLSDNGILDTADAPVPVNEPKVSGQRLAFSAANPVNWMGMLRGTAQMVAGSAEFAAGLLRPVSSLNGPIAARRRYSAARVALGDVKRICRTFDVTISDVALAALTESYRNMLVRRGEPPRPDSLRTLLPSQGGVMLPCLPVEEDNPVLRLRMVHTRLARKKATAPRQAGSVVAATARVVPFPLAAWTMNLLARLPQRNVATLMVNVPGPRQPLQVMGCNVVRVLPIPPIGIQLRTAAAILSYGDGLFFGILADFDTVPDVDELARGVETAVARLVTRSKRRKATRDRSGLSLVVNA